MSAAGLAGMSFDKLGQGVRRPSKGTTGACSGTVKSAYPRGTDRRAGCEWGFRMPCEGKRLHGRRSRASSPNPRVVDRCASLARRAQSGSSGRGSGAIRKRQIGDMAPSPDSLKGCGCVQGVRKTRRTQPAATATLREPLEAMLPGVFVVPTVGASPSVTRVAGRRQYGIVNEKAWRVANAQRRAQWSLCGRGTGRPGKAQIMVYTE